MSNFSIETVQEVRHWTDRLFSFSTSRDPAFRFRNGEFTMIGLQTEQKALLRAYSLASANYEPHLEFFSIKVPDGPLTSKLQHLKPGDEIVVGRKPTGTLVIDNLHSGRNLYLLSTGTGLAPFLSIVRDPETYEKFEKVVLVHGCRFVEELAYAELLSDQLQKDEFLGPTVREQLLYYPTVTREPFRHTGRITTLMQNGALYRDLNLPHLSAEHDRAMICGSVAMLADLKAHLLQAGLTEGNHGEAGQFVVEKSFAER